MTGHAQALQVGAVKALTTQLDWNDVVHRLGWLQNTFALASAAKRVIP